MTFGLSGASSTGKSSLARALADHFGFALYETDTLGVLAEIGVNALGDLSIEDRLTAQEYLLEHHWKTTQAMGRPFIADRTPLDFIGYTLAELTMNNGNAAIGERAYAYYERALRVTRNTYAGIIICSPLPSYAADPKRPPPNRGFQIETQLIIEGALGQVGTVSRIILKTDDFAARFTYADEFLTETMAELVKARNESTLN